MKNIKNIIILVIFSVFSQAFARQLENGALDQINNSVALGAVGLNLDYKAEEVFFPTGVPQAKSIEKGTILGIYFDARTAFKEKIYTDLYLDYFDGKLKYEGVTLPPPPNPTLLVYKQWHRFFNINLKSGYIFSLAESNSFQAIPYVGAGYRYWNRQYSSDGGMEQRYKHYKVVAGLKLNWLLTDNFILSPYAEGGQIFSAHMKDDENLGYKLGNKPIYETGLELNYKIFGKFFLSSFASYSQFKYGISAIQSDSFLEPDSKTGEIKVGVGVRYSWNS